MNAGRRQPSQPVILRGRPLPHPGKTSIAQLVATRLDGEVVSADSMQVYRGMDIGNRQTSRKRTTGTSLWLRFGGSGEPFSRALFQRMRGKASWKSNRKGKRSVLAGGTGFLRAAIDAEFPDGANR